MNLTKSTLWIGLLSFIFAVVAVAADSNLRVMDLTEQIEVIFSKSTMDQALAHLKTLPYLSYWLLVVSFMSLFGTLQAFYSTALLKQFQFNLKQQEVTPLAGRLFGCWTTLATLIRVCCALEPANITVYRLTIATFILAMSLFIHAVIIARAMSFRNAMMPMVFALPSFVWMVFFPPHGRI